MEQRAVEQFGSLGSGNHFVEVCLDEGGAVWAVLHPGSRGVGNRLAMHHIEVAKKIDRSFVARMAQRPGDFVIVSGIARLLHSIGLRVVAEGVEDEATWQLLADLGCYAAQGYLMAPALTAEEADVWLQTPVWSPGSVATG